MHLVILGLVPWHVRNVGTVTGDIVVSKRKSPQYSTKTVQRPPPIHQPDHTMLVSSVKGLYSMRPTAPPYLSCEIWVSRQYIAARVTSGELKAQ